MSKQERCSLLGLHVSRLWGPSIHGSSLRTAPSFSVDILQSGERSLGTSEWKGIEGEGIQ